MKHKSHHAFTLVELLVVIGIIALLISILLPTLQTARTAGQITACLSNIRQLSMAVQSYLVDNKQTLPEAIHNNKTALWSAKGTLKAPWTPHTRAGTGGSLTYHVLPSIGEALAKHVGPGEKVWQCPTGGPDTTFFDPYESKGPNPMTGFTAEDSWLPNYFYMGTKVYLGLTPNPSVAATRVTTQFNAADWTVRSVSGLRASKAKSVSNQSSDKICIFVEYKSIFHSRTNKDIHNLQPGEKYKYIGNFAYLDGHAETRRYGDRASYMANLHDPIRQSWMGVDFVSTFPEQYDPKNFYRDGK